MLLYFLVQNSGYWLHGWVFVGATVVEEVRLAVAFDATVALSDAVEEDAEFEPLNIISVLDFVLPVPVESLLPAILLKRRLIEPLRLPAAVLEDTVMVEV